MGAPWGVTIGTRGIISPWPVVARHLGDIVLGCLAKIMQFGLWNFIAQQKICS